MKVVFINTFYYPELYERNKLKRLQEEIDFTIKYIAYDSKSMNEYNLRKYRYHQRMKDRIKLVPENE